MAAIFFRFMVTLVSVAVANGVAAAVAVGLVVVSVALVASVFFRVR